MFDGETAWFSSSITEEDIKKWEDHGGKTVTQDNAMFLFSRDATNPDTTEVHQSDAYIDEHISVIHPQYIADCVEAGGRDTVVLMEYNFPPTEVLKAVDGKVKYRWQTTERPAPESSSQGVTGNTENSRSRLQRSEKPKQSSSQEMEYLDIDELPKITGELQCLTPGQNGFKVHAVSGKV